MSINDDVKFSKSIQEGFYKKAVSWNKYKSEITTQPKNKSLFCKINPTFSNMNRFPALSFRNDDKYPRRGSFVKHYMPLVEFKNVNALINKKPFLDQHIKNKQETYEKLVEMWSNADYTAGNLQQDYLHHQNNYNLIGTNLLKQTNESICQQIHFTRKLEKHDDVIMFFIAEKLQKTILIVSLVLLITTE